MPRSRSRSIASRTCASISRSCSAPVSSRNRSASVDLPWSMCAMTEKFLMRPGSMLSCHSNPSLYLPEPHLHPQALALPRFPGDCGHMLILDSFVEGRHFALHDRVEPFELPIETA